MNILVTSNHGNTFHPKEGADIRKNKLIAGLARNNRILVLESDRYIADKPSDTSNVSVEYFHEFFIFKKPLSFLLDVNPSFLSLLYNVIKKEHIDIIQISYPYGFLATRFVLWRQKKKIPIIYDAHNVESDAVKQIPNSGWDFLAWCFLIIYIPILEFLTVKFAADSIICVSNEDRVRFIDKYGLDEGKIKVIPSGTTICAYDVTNNKEDLKKRWGISGKKAILFHGTYSYPPNREAFELIIDYIAPQVQAARDNAVFLLAGNGVPVFQKENVRSIGFVEDICLLLQTADIAR
jgi:glycosyltransferase involved in cell wall biosynthesis